MVDSRGFSAKYLRPGHLYAVVFEDDGRVGYAYLLDSRDKICGDTWLYNRCDTPTATEWNELERAPFANPASYAAESRYALPNSGADVRIDWRGDVALIFIRENLAGALSDGVKPGWATNALNDGPLAKVLRP